MAIITIFGGDFTGGDALAEDVAKTLDYRSVGREVLAETIRSYGIPEAKLNEVLERDPHWWDRWIENLRPYRIALQAAMCEVATGGNLVYHGHLGHELLPGIRHVLRVLLTAPMELRIENCRKQRGLNVAAAQRYVDHVDKARTRRLIALFDADWKDPTRYGLVLNMAQFSSEAAKQAIVEMARLKEFQPTAASEEAFQNLTLMSRVQATLTMSSTLQKFPIGVQARNGAVTVSGMLPQGRQHEIVEQIKRVRGVNEVLTDFINLPARGGSG